MSDVSLKCSCGKVKGHASNVSSHGGTRIVCYCDDCQAFARFLNNEGETLDEYGGTDIYQLTPSQIKIEEGADQIRCVKLSKKGMYRWFTACCNTPIGNTMNGAMPFVGLIHNFMDDEGARDQNLGPVRFYVQGNHALKELPKGRFNAGFPIGCTFRIMTKILLWKIKGKQNPSPFFDKEGVPVSEPKVLSASQFEVDK